MFASDYEMCNIEAQVKYKSTLTHSMHVPQHWPKYEKHKHIVKVHMDLRIQPHVRSYLPFLFARTRMRLFHSLPYFAMILFDFSMVMFASEICFADTHRFVQQMFYLCLFKAARKKPLNVRA